MTPLLLRSITLRKNPPSVILDAGITLRRSKRLKSQLYSPLIALSCFSESIVASHGHIARSLVNLVPATANWGYEWG